MSFASFSNRHLLALSMVLVSACGGGGGGSVVAAADSSTASATPPSPTPTPETTSTDSPTLTAATVLGCATQALTCVEIASTSTADQASVPVTFGQPFRAGDLMASQRLIARDADGNTVPLQMDERSSYADGSARFGVFSTQVANLKAGEKRIVNLYRDAGAVTDNNASANAGSYDLQLTANVFTPQVSLVTFGNRLGNTAGTAFLAGEIVTLQVGDLPGELFALTVTADMAGGSTATLTKMAEAFLALVNQKSPTYRAYKVGEGGGFEKLWITARNPATGSFPVRVLYAGSATSTVSVLQNFAAGRTYKASARSALDAALAAGVKPRLRGAVATEYTVVTPFVDSSSGAQHPQLTARLHVRLYENGQRIRTDMVIENNWTYEPSPGNVTYALTATQGGQTMLQQDVLTHNHHARWHKVLWSGTESKAIVRHHMPYFLASRATWNYDLSIAVPDSVLAGEATSLAKADTSPMGAALITPYFPTTGGRAEIGPLPRWTALYLVTQDSRARASMLANADAAAGIPIHYRDKPTDQPVNLETHPGLALVIGTSTPQDALPTVANGDTIWSPDVSHQASFAYIPYLVTGDAFYLDEMMFWATWNMGKINPGYRGGGDGLIQEEQLRGQAWAMRALSEVTRSLPDAHVQKAYFQRKLQANLNWYVAKYPRNTKIGDISPLGMVEKGDEIGKTAPWQNDFMALIMGQIAESGESLALEYFNWISRFTVGRFTHEADGFCRAQAPGYYITIRDSAGAYISDWGKLYQANWPGVNCSANKSVDGTPDSAADYAAYARAMLGVSASPQFAIAGASDALSYWQSATAAMNKAYPSDPTWAIVRRSASQ